MSRPQKIIPPVKGSFNSILGSIAIGSGVGKRAALKLAKEKTGIVKPVTPQPPKK